MDQFVLVLIPGVSDAFVTYSLDLASIFYLPLKLNALYCYIRLCYILNKVLFSYHKLCNYWISQVSFGFISLP